MRRKTQKLAGKTEQKAPQDDAFFEGITESIVTRVLNLPWAAGSNSVQSAVPATGSTLTAAGAWSQVVNQIWKNSAAEGLSLWETIDRVKRVAKVWLG